MKTRLTRLLSVLLLGTMALTGCGSNGAGAGTNETAVSANAGDLKIAKLISGGEPGSLHPALSQGTHESIILDHIFEGLMKRDENSETVYGMAESHTVSEDGLTYTFKIRPDVKWSNGDPVTAKDFEVAWKYVLDPDTGSNYAFQLYYLEGAEEYNTGKGSVDEVGVKALDDTTLEVKLKLPTSYFLQLCAFYTYYPVNSKLQEEQGSEWSHNGDTFVSNGPFSVKAWNHDESVELVKNEEYYNKDAVKLDGVTFYISEDLNTQWQMYQNGEIDINYDLPADVLGQLNAQNDPELKIVPELANYFYRFNTQEKPFNNVKVRKALSMAVDRQLIIDEVTQGGQIPAYAVVPGNIPDADETVDFRENGGDFIKEDVEEAQKLLAEGLAEEGMSSLDFTILYNTHENHKKVAEAIQQMWNENLGVNVSLENVEMKVKVDREHKLDYDVSRAGWVGDYIDPNTFLDMYTSWSSQNDTGWTSDKYDELITKASAEIDPVARMGYLHEAEALIMEDMPIMPLYFYTRGITTKPYLTGVTKAINRDVSLIYADINQ
ncbi:peptide ABC transporter substrate-binding protein [Cellulosilyticum ruminicola]|uniref:peptide ABC transporter substrate-binding protein n=1 Tax=Cellulosilyticum ruminicola TaxID=425254 RepID=UPI0006CFB01A|nr:peptide ABC transporter substrate-binding protein [Cellulosilyticum ruminicola]